MGVLWPDIRGELALGIFLQWKTGNWDITWIKSVKKYKMEKKFHENGKIQTKKLE